jgi:hypothetical protein
LHPREGKRRAARAARTIALKKKRYTRLSRALRGSGERRPLGPVRQEEIVQRLDGNSLNRKLFRNRGNDGKRKRGYDVMAAEMVGVIVGNAIASVIAMPIAVIMHDTVIVIAMLRHNVRCVAIFAIEAGQHAERGGQPLKRQHRYGQG